MRTTTISILCALAACADEPAPSLESGRLAGLVLVSGPLRGASVAIEQLDERTGGVREHIGDGFTDDSGRYAIASGLANGIVRVTARGGAFTDLATGATIQLDADAELTSLARVALLEEREDLLVSPVGHLIDVRAVSLGGNLGEAVDDSAAHLGRHFGNVDWTRVVPVALDRPATSPTEAVRAGLVQAALGVLARDIAMAAGASPQEVNVYALTRRWADDVAAGVFDGNDDNDRAAGTGLQLGLCPSVERGCAVPPAGCATGACRTLCDLYAGTPRALLGGEMTKVIQDRGPGGLNQTGLAVADTLAIARSVSDNVDGELFGAACIETLDRLPPQITFETPASGSYVRGVLRVRVTAVDDTDPSPRAQIEGYPDGDGDPTNAVAQAEIDTAGFDGALEIRARATDLAGNVGTVRRSVLVDNTPPGITLAATGFFVDGTTWWTTTAAPTLTGTVTDASPVHVKVAIPNRAPIAAVVAGSSWSVALPADSLDPAGTIVAISAADEAGNIATASQRLRPDTAPPELSFAASTVNDEATEPVAFTDAPAETPTHAHTGPVRDLALSGTCASVTKHSYLLASTPPVHGIEQPGPNPIRYQLLTDDPGVGIASGTTQYRVRRRVGSTTTTVLDWTSAGTGVPVGGTVRRHAVGIYSDVVASLATTPGRYEIELRATDRLARTTTVMRCFDLALKAPPLLWKSNPGGTPTQTHTYALDSLRLELGAAHDLLAARLLNDDATGASLIDQQVSNGTAQTVYVTVDVTKPSLVYARRRFRDGYVQTRSDPDPGCAPGDLECDPPPVSYAPALVTIPIGNQAFPVKVFELIGGVPTTEIPCVAPCPASGAVFQFALPPRSGSGPARQFLIMTMIGKVTELRPSDAMSPSVPPYVDTSYVWIRTGQQSGTRTYRVSGVLPEPPQPLARCAQAIFDENGEQIGCSRRGTYRRARVVLQAGLESPEQVLSVYGVSPTASLPPEVASTVQQRFLSWMTTEETLP